MRVRTVNSKTIGVNLSTLRLTGGRGRRRGSHRAVARVDTVRSDSVSHVTGLNIVTDLRPF